METMTDNADLKKHDVVEIDAEGETITGFVQGKSSTGVQSDVYEIEIVRDTEEGLIETDDLYVFGCTAYATRDHLAYVGTPEFSEYRLAQNPSLKAHIEALPEESRSDEVRQ